MMLTTDELWLLEQAVSHKKGLLNHHAVAAAKSSSRVLIQQELPLCVACVNREGA